MYKFSYLVFTFLLAVNINAYESCEEDEDHVHIRVYYESQCSDSRDFVIEQLQPALDLLHEYIVLEFIPFGKAHSINETEFVCQHGPTECLGNMVQACTLDLIDGKVDDRRLAQYVACELRTEAGTRKDWQCVNQLDAKLSKVKKCVSRRKGIELQLKNECKTNVVKPDFIPTITFDDKYDQDIQDSALKNLIRTVCSYLSYSVKPCRQRYKKSSRKTKASKVTMDNQ